MSFFSFQDIIACVTGIMLLVTLLLAMELLTRKEGGSEYPAVDIESLIDKLQALQQRLNAFEQRIAARRQRLNSLVQGKTITPEEVIAIERSLRVLKNSNTAAGERVAKLEGRYGILKSEAKGAKRTEDGLKTAIAAANRNIQEEADKRRITLIVGKATGKKPLFVECSAGQIVVGERTPGTGVANMLKEFPGEGKDPMIRFVNWATANGRAKEKVQYVVLVRPDGLQRFEPIAGTLLNEGYLVGWDVWPATRTLFPRAGGGGN